MSEESINSILNSSGDYGIALLTTFNLDIDFFERGILSILLKRGIRKVSLFVDARQLAESVNSVSRCHLGSDYMIHPISVNGAFHPKVILLLGERKARVIVSSANLTVNGYFSNGEVFSAIDYDADHPEGLSAVHSAIALFEELNSKYSHEYDLPLFEEIRALWYYGKAGVEKDRALITNLNEPLLSQIKARINNVSTIDIAVPYYDNELSALKFLANAFPAAKIKLYLQNKKCRIPNDLLRTLPNIRCIVFDEYNVSAKQSRRSFYHGKVICFSGDNRSIVVYGSANCTRSALQLTPSTGGNVECVLVDYGHASEFSAFFKNFTPTNAKLEGDVLSFDDPPTNTFSFMYGILKPGWVEAELRFSCVKIVPVIDASFHGNTLNYEWIGRTLIVKLPVDEYSPVGAIFDIDLAFEGSTSTIKCWIIDLSRLAMFRANSAMSLSREFDLSGSGDQYVDDMRVLLSALTFTPEELDAREKVFIAVEGQSMSDEETDDMDEGGIISYTPPPLEEVELYRLYKRVDKVFAQRLIHLESSTIKALDPSKVSAIKECKDVTIGSIPSKRRATNAEQSFLRYYKRRLSDLLSLHDKHICMVESSGVLDGIAFYHEELDFDSSPSRIRGEERAEWHRRALTALSGCELVFADPDNGLIDRKPSAKGAQKYILPEEIECYFKRGQQVVYYQHRPRINETNWGAFKRRILMKIPEARLLAVSFNRWSCRTYIFVLHENEYTRYKKLIGSFLESDWGQLKVGGKPAFVPEKI